MPTFSLRIASRRQVTVPLDLLEVLQIDEGDVLELTATNGQVVSGRGLKLLPATLFTEELVKDLKRREKSLDSGQGVDVKNIDQLAAKLSNHRK